MSTDSLFAALNAALPILDQAAPPAVCLIYSGTDDAFSLLDASNPDDITEHFLAEDRTIVVRLSVDEIGDIFASRFSDRMAATLATYARQLLTGNAPRTINDILPALSHDKNPKKDK